MMINKAACISILPLIAASVAAASSGNTLFRGSNRELTYSICESALHCGYFNNNIDFRQGVTKLTGPNFKICPQLSVECTLRCNAETADNATKLYIKVGGGRANTTNYDAKDESLQCNKRVSVTNENANVLTGLSYYLESSVNLRDVPFSCKCPESDSGSSFSPLSTLGCLSSSDTVHVQHVGPVAIEDLRVGDSVLVEDDMSTGPVFEPVYGFGHFHDTKFMDFSRIYIANNNNSMAPPLELTADHMIYIHQKGTAVGADQVQIGDLAVAADGSLRQVVEISHGHRKQGMYMPLTTSGYLMVNDIKVSSYVSIKGLAPPRIARYLSQWLVSEQTLFHAWLSPYRMYCLGFSPNMCQIPSSRDRDDSGSSDSDEGIIGWLLFAKSLLEFANNSNLIVQIFACIVVLPLLLLVNAAELVLGPFMPFTPPVIAAMLSVGIALFVGTRASSRESGKK